jgi:outer membrane biosynthesis protein TonB
VKRARAKFHCEAEEEGDLELRVGDVVEIEKEEEDGWWEGSVVRGGKRFSGIFPANYVEVMTPEPPQRPPPDPQPKPAPAPAPASPRQPVQQQPQVPRQPSPPRAAAAPAPAPVGVHAAWRAGHSEADLRAW